MKDDATARALAAAKLLCEEKMLIHRVADAMKPLDHIPGCPACVLRDALAELGVIDPGKAS